MIKINYQELELRHWTLFNVENVDELLSIAKLFGQAIPSRKNSNELIDTLTVKTKSEARPKSLSAIYGEGKFPFHTDGAYLSNPPKYVILRSPKNIDNCPTLICEPKFNESDKKELAKNVWLANGGHGKFYTTFLEQQSNDYRLRFDLGCMRPALPDFSTSEKIMTYSISNSEMFEINWVKNQCVIFNNWKLLHSRADATNTVERTLERIWIKN